MIEVNNLSKTYAAKSKNPVEVLKDVSLRVEEGETVAVTGSSGSGKTTFLTLAAGLDEPTSGSVIINGQNINDMTQNSLTRFRAVNIGFVFQRFHLLPHFSALENVTLPLDILKQPDAVSRAQEALDSVGLSHRSGHLPSALSGGECQRVAIARAIVTNPKIVFADEPTGSLDHETAETVSSIFFSLVKERKLTMIIVTHNNELADLCSRRVRLFKGTLA